MPKTLEQLRELLRDGLGELRSEDIRDGKRKLFVGVDWATSEPKTTYLDFEKTREARSFHGSIGKFRISVTGDDAILHFGKHNGHHLSDIIEDDPSYLKWMIRSSDFDQDLLNICQYHLDARLFLYPHSK